MARTLINRINHHIETTILPENQCGFRDERSTVDMNFTLKQKQEKCKEQQRPLYTVFIDSTITFDNC